MSKGFKKARIPAGSMVDILQAMQHTDEQVAEDEMEANFMDGETSTRRSTRRKEPHFRAASMADSILPTPDDNQQPAHHEPISKRITRTLSSSQQSNQGSHSASGADTTTIPSSSGEDTGRRTRGAARPLSIWGTTEKLLVEFNDKNQPLGINGDKLQSQLGVIARNGIFTPLMFTDWRADGLHSFKEQIWEEVKLNTNVPEAFKANCLKSVGKKWKDWKDVLKKYHYDTYKTDEERLANCPERVEEVQWEILVAYWGSKLFKERSVANTQRQAKKIASHTCGRKAFCRVRDEETKKNQGKEPDRVELYFLTHKKKDGTPVDKPSAESMAQLNELLSEVPKQEQTPEFREEVFTKVFGKDGHGRVRTFGLGPCPSEVFGTKYDKRQDKVDRDQLREHVRNEVLAELQDKFAEVDEKCVVLDEKYARLEAMEQIMEQRYSEFLVHAEKMGLTFPMPTMAAHNVKSVKGGPDHSHSVFGENGSGHGGSSNKLGYESSDQVRQNVSGQSRKVQQIEDDFRSDHEQQNDEVEQVHLLSSNIPKHLVAKGILISKDPSKQVGVRPLGTGFCVVLILKVVKPRYCLPIQCDAVSTVGQALNHYVAWPETDVIALY